MSISPFGRGGPLEPEMFRDQEYELERKAERYSELHGGDDDAERPPGFIGRLLRRLLPRRRDS